MVKRRRSSTRHRVVKEGPYSVTSAKGTVLDGVDQRTAWDAFINECHRNCGAERVEMRRGSALIAWQDPPRGRRREHDEG